MGAAGLVLTGCDNGGEDEGGDTTTTTTSTSGTSEKPTGSDGDPTDSASASAEGTGTSTGSADASASAEGTDTGTGTESESESESESATGTTTEGETEGETEGGMCSGLGPRQCMATEGCMPIGGAAVDMTGVQPCLGAREFIECQVAIGCGDAITFACDGEMGPMYQFLDTCIPEGWVDCGPPPGDLPACEE